MTYAVGDPVTVIYDIAPDLQATVVRAAVPADLTTPGLTDDDLDAFVIVADADGNERCVCVTYIYAEGEDRPIGPMEFLLLQDISDALGIDPDEFKAKNG